MVGREAPSAGPPSESLEPGVHAREYLQAVRRRWWIPVATAAIACAIALALSTSATKLYESTATVLFTNSEPLDTLLPSSSSRSLDPERDVNTGVALVRSNAVARKVRRELGLPLTVPQLLSEVHATPQGNSNVISISVRDRSPARAAAIANAFARSYVAFRRSSARVQYNEAVSQAERELRAMTRRDRASAKGRELESQLNQLQTASSFQTGGVQLLDAAKVPTSAATPRPKRNAAIGLVVGLFIGCLIAIALESFDRRLKTEDDIEEFAGLPVLGRIPRLRPDLGAITGSGAEAFATLALNLRLRKGRRKGAGAAETVLVTSAGTDEGKTSVALGLGAALASLGARVIVIEADLRMPSFARYLGLGPSLGLSGVLAEACSLDSALVEIDPAKPSKHNAAGESCQGSLIVLPAGGGVANPQLVLSGEVMGDVLRHARSRADVVIVDVPPLGVVSDALTLTAALDTSIFVTRVNRTTKEHVLRALTALRGAGIDIAGVVVTGVKSRPSYPAKPADAAVPVGTPHSSVAPLDRQRASVPRTE